MTRYDPFTYGEVPLDSKQQQGAEPDAEDLLFAEGEPTKQAPPADSSWALLNEDVDDLLPGADPNAAETIEFGAEVLGEGLPEDMPLSEPVEADASMSLEELAASAPAAAAMDPPSAPEAGLAPEAVAEPEAVPATAEGDAAAPKTAAKKAGANTREIRRKPLAVRSAQPTPDASSSDKPLPAVPQRRRMPLLAAFLPLLICAGGGTASSWFWVMQGNPVMASILGATTLVSALFAWLLLRG